jgi:transcriptional regulator with XRE-family HTH domain
MSDVEETGHEAAPTGGRRSLLPAERRQVVERIKLARGKAGLTQAQLGKKLGVTASAVAQWEIGLGLPATGRLATLADLFDVSVDWLLGKPPQAGRPEAAGPAMQDARQLLEEAGRLGLDLRQIVAEARQRRGLDENHAALTDADVFPARHGLCSDGKRQF